MSIRTYSELITIPNYLDRFKYLQLNGSVGQDTFGYDRYLNQILYSSSEWKRFRRQVIIRDEGRDLACEGFEILHDRIIVHHIEPITVEDVLNRSPKVFDLDNVVCVTHRTHQAIHYGDVNLLPLVPKERAANDTCPWKKN